MESGLSLPMPAANMASFSSPTAEFRTQQKEKAAEEFEAVFISMMLKTMRQSMSEEMFAGDKSDTFGGMFDQFLGQHMAAQGGVGMSRLFEDQAIPAASLSALNNAAIAPALTGNAATGTQIDDSNRKNPLQTIQLKAYQNALSIAQ